MLPGFFSKKERRVMLLNFLFYWIVIPGFLIYISIIFDAKIMITFPRVKLLYIIGVFSLIASFDYASRTAYLMKHFGKGLPVARYHPTKLVKIGLFNRVRHPLYFAYSFYLIGIAIFYQSFSFYSIIVPCFIILILIYAKFSEEYILKKRFGDEFLKYKKSVPFIIPRKRNLDFNRAPGAVYWIMYLVLKPVLLKVLYNVEFKTQENIPEEGPMVFIAFHTNYLDPFLAGTGAKHFIQWVMSSLYFQDWLKRFFFTHLGAFPRKRYSADVKSIRTFLEMVRDKSCIGYYPEGARSWLGNPISLLDAAVKLLVRSEILIVPVKVHGGYQGWPRWTNTWRRVKIVVEYGKPFRLNKEASLEENKKVIYDNLIIDDLWEVETLTKINPIAGLERIIWECPQCSLENPWVIKEKDQMVCKKCSARVKLKRDFKIEFQGKEKRIFTIPEIYEFIKKRLLERRKKWDEIVVNFKKFLIQTEEEKIWKELQDAKVIIKDSELIVSSSKYNFKSKIKDLNWITIEKNFILQFKIQDYFMRMYFDRDVLKWFSLLETDILI